MSPIRISLIIPTYNRGNLIRETIESALAQTAPFHEIIVVDDGSTDDTAAVLAPYAGRIQVIVLPNGGVQRARNTGVAAASGEYVALCDSDDLLEPNFVATAAWLAANTDVDALYCNFRVFDGRAEHDDKFSGAPSGFFEGARRDAAFCTDIPDLYARLLTYQPLFPTGSVLRKTFYQAIGGYDTRFNRVGSEDLEFALRAVGAGRVALCTEVLTRVRKHGANDSADTMRQVSGEIVILEFALQHHASAQHYADTVRRSLTQRRIDVFNAAFARGAFDIAGAMLAQLQGQPRDRKLRIKALITRLPRLLREPLWRASQA